MTREDFPIEEARQFARGCLKAFPGARITVREPQKPQGEEPGELNKPRQPL